VIPEVVTRLRAASEMVTADPFGMGGAA
jgi:hypothetical protein